MRSGDRGFLIYGEIPSGARNAVQGVGASLCHLETFAKPTVIPAFAGIHNENPTWETKNHDTLSLFH